MATGRRNLWLRALSSGSAATARKAINQIRYLVVALRERSSFSPTQAKPSKSNAWQLQAPSQWITPAVKEMI
jgi:hypothetical protein